MFVQRENRTMLAAATATLSLIYTVTVFDLRRSHRNPLWGLILHAIQSAVMVAAFMMMFYVVGVRNSPIRGDFLLFVMSGIFMFRAHVGAIGSVAGAGSSVSNIMKHGPMNTAVVITGSALAVLYRTFFSFFVILGGYYLFVPFEIEDPVGCTAMVLLGWASGCSIGLVLLSVRPWSPEFTRVASLVIQRAQMICSGKMFVANALPGHVLVYFEWNPLFHVIDQTRGFAFINYTPHHSSIAYPIYVTLALTMLGLMGEFAGRQYESLSWSAAR